MVSVSEVKGKSSNQNVAKKIRLGGSACGELKNLAGLEADKKSLSVFGNISIFWEGLGIRTTETSDKICLDSE